MSLESRTYKCPMFLGGKRISVEVLFLSQQEHETNVAQCSVVEHIKLTYVAASPLSRLKPEYFSVISPYICGFYFECYEVYNGCEEEHLSTFGGSITTPIDTIFITSYKQSHTMPLLNLRL